MAWRLWALVLVALALPLEVCGRPLNLTPNNGVHHCFDSGVGRQAHLAPLPNMPNLTHDARLQARLFRSSWLLPWGRRSLAQPLGLLTAPHNLQHLGQAQPQTLLPAPRRRMQRQPSIWARLSRL